MRPLDRLLRPWHRASPVPVWLLIVLALLAAHNLVQLVAAAPGPDHAVDLRPPYLGAGILLDGGNPYADELLKESWLEIARREGFTGLSMPGLPGTPLVYPPWALPLFLPLVMTRWLTAVPIWYVAIALLLATIVLLLGSLSGSTPRLVVTVDVIALTVAFKAIDWAVLVGQPLFLCLALGLASWSLTRTGHPIGAGVALGLAAFKPHLALPFALLALTRRRWITLVTAALTIAVLCGIFVALCDQPAAAVASLADNLTEHSRITYDPAAAGYPLSRKIVWSTSLAALAEVRVPGAHRYWLALDALLLAALLPFWIRPLATGRVSDARAFSILAVVTLLATPHYHYDCLILLPLYLVARSTDRAERIALLVASAPLLLPINGILSLVGLPTPLDVLYFSVQLTLLALAAVLTWGHLRHATARLRLLHRGHTPFAVDTTLPPVPFHPGAGCRSRNGRRPRRAVAGLEGVLEDEVRALTRYRYNEDRSCRVVRIHRQLAGEWTLGRWVELDRGHTGTPGGHGGSRASGDDPERRWHVHRSHPQIELAGVADLDRHRRGLSSADQPEVQPPRHRLDARNTLSTLVFGHDGKFVVPGWMSCPAGCR